MKSKVLVETSARHVHLSPKDLETLFGEGAQLTSKKCLMQPGQFACVERVDVVGPKNTFKNVTIIGPCRRQTQVELSATDARSIGVTAPVRDSGDLAGSGACKIVGPAGEIDISEGVIIAKRHIHFGPHDAVDFGVTDNEIVQVRIESEDRSLIFDDVLCRVGPDYVPSMHIDVDEANAAGCKGEVHGIIIRKN